MLSIVGAAGGCNPIPPPTGSLKSVHPLSDQPRLGNVYIVRGLFGNFSTGMDDLQQDLQAAGVRSRVYQHTQAGSLAKAIAKAYRSAPASEPLVLVGHSLGADDVVSIAKQLQKNCLPVHLLITVDPVYVDPVPANVQHAINYYRSVGILEVVPALRGVAIKPDKDAGGRLENMNLNDHPELTNTLTNHFTIDTNPKVRQAIVQRVLEVCGPRSAAADTTVRPNLAPADGRAAWKQAQP
jgi:hypothetical protein